ncbi:MAG: hypothetical protein IE885_08710 [Campylobacterales bacterium]|nr:hypothetical protein [Campylobacterales bacterium]
MQKQLRDAYTTIELIFVVIVIGILAAVALPRFGDTADQAYETKGGTTLAAVRTSISTERQKRILRGDTTGITDLGNGTNAFETFSADQDGNAADVLQYPVPNCATGERGCWIRTDATHYSFRFVKSTDGQANFELTGNKLICADTDDTNCKKLE